MKQLTFVFLLIITSHFITLSQPKSTKRGIAANITSVSDLKILSPGISWFYNWAQFPDSKVLSYLSSEKVQYIPMVWNGTQSSVDAANTYYASDPSNGFLLGFNEPNLPDQANMTPSVAAAFWPKLEQLAATYNLKLVAPAVNYSPGIFDPKYGKIMYTDPYSYLDTFFVECPDCQVDYIAVHWYGHGGLETVVNNMWEKYHKPIWVTEFASWDASVNPMTLQLEKDFMVKYVEYLENNPNVFRYAWFTARSDYNDYIDILGKSGILTELGNLYVNMPVHDPSYFQIIPARVEAENYTIMAGIQLQTTNDINGLLNVGYIDANDYLEYNIDVPETKSYPFKIRYSAIKNTQISIVEGLTEIKLANISSTSSYNTWQTLESTIDLTAGQHTLRFLATNNGFNLNWIQFGDVVSSITDISTQKLDFKLLNNPVKDGILRIIPPTDLKSDLKSTIEIMDFSGRIISSKKIQINSNEKINLNLNENGKLKSGVYLLRINSEIGFSSDKFIVE